MGALYLSFVHALPRMDDAYDTVRNQRVRAVNASATRFPDRYLCPVCQCEVFYAAGEFQSPHFRHWPGEESDDCERKAKNFHRDVPLSQHEYERLDAVLVALQASTAQGNVVSFAVRFRPAYKVGFVNFISGETSTPYTIHPNLRQQYFRIAGPENTRPPATTRAIPMARRPARRIGRSRPKPSSSARNGRRHWRCCWASGGNSRRQA